MAQMTKKGARSVTATLDRIATLFQQEHKALGVPEKIAMDFAYRCDLLSDDIEKRAGLDKAALDDFDPVKEQGFDPEEIGEEKPGPLEDEPDEKYMAKEFTQQENRELRERQEDGDLGPTPNEEPMSPSSGKQAAYEVLGRQAMLQQLAAALSQVQTASGTYPELSSRLNKFAHAILNVQMGVLAGATSARVASRTVSAAETLLPRLNSQKAASLIGLAIKVAEEEEEKEEAEPEAEEPKESAKKAGEVPEAFKKQWDKGEGGEEKKEEGKEEGKEEKKEEKKASHGFNLFA